MNDTPARQFWSPLMQLNSCVWLGLLGGLFVAPLGAQEAKPAVPEKKLPLAGETFLVEGRAAFLIPPAKAATDRPTPWVWYAPTLPNLPGEAERWMFERFTQAGLGIAGIDVGESYGSPDGRKLFTALYDELTHRRGYSQKPVLLGRSRGGLMTLGWAADNPDKVGGFAGIYPVCSLVSYPGLKRASGAYGLTPEELEARLAEHNPVDKLAALARAKVPLFAIHGDVDQLVPLAANSGTVRTRYAALGGSMELIVSEGQGHNMWSGFFQCQALVDFVIATAHAQRAVGVPPAAGRGGWRAGLAKAVLTPEKSVWLAGYGSKRPPDGKLHDLWMKALALADDNGRRVVLITSDFQGVPSSMSDRVFTQLKTRYGLDRADVMFTFSHNHCGPRLGDDLVDYYPVDAEQVALIAEYTDQMVARCVTLVGDALANLSPARLQTGEGTATFAVNRRNNREADVPALVTAGTPLVGPVDHTVPVLTVTRPDGRLAAILFGYACHPTTLSFLTWCGDYPGFAQAELEAQHPGALAMFVNTCGGDQNPLPRRTVELCQKYGHQLATAVEAVLQRPLQPVSPGIRTAFELVELPYLQTVSRDDLQGLLKDSNAIKARWAARLLAKLDAGEGFEAAYPYPLHAWRLGREMLVIGMGAETVVDYALRFKHEFGPGTWVCGYADDMIAYIPSRRVWLEGGYEGGSNLYEYGRPAFRWDGSIEDRIAAGVQRLVKQVRE